MCATHLKCKSHTGRYSFIYKAHETSFSNQIPFHSLLEVKDSYLGLYRTSEFTEILTRRACLRTVTVGESAMSMTIIGDLHSRKVVQKTHWIMVKQRGHFMNYPSHFNGHLGCHWCGKGSPTRGRASGTFLLRIQARLFLAVLLVH